tara:strand:- start:273 stop:1061 length:789 start_codon:yes stop_codon:yes gene_type:complete
MSFDRKHQEQSDLEKYFNQNSGRLVHKWSHYFDIYDRHFKRFRGEPVVILEIGVFHGGSLQMWKNYFGDKVKIYGVDINPDCKALEEENVEIFIGSQSDKFFLRDLKAKIPRADIIIDDGGHTMTQQRITFEELFDHVKEDGIYLCEDMHTSYWLEYGGGVKRRGTFIEYSKKLIDSLNAYHSRQSSFKPSSFTKSVDSLHFYDSVLVIEKKNRPKPIDLKSGVESYKSDYSQKEAPAYKRIPLSIINKVLRFLRLPGFIWK